MSQTARMLRRMAAIGGWAVLAAVSAGMPAPPAALAQEAGTDAGHPPHVTIVAPASPSYRLGEPVELSGAVSDAEGDVEAGDLRWRVERRTGAVRETVLEAAGPRAAFTPDRALGVGTSYEVRLEVTQADGLGDAATLVMEPQTAIVRLSSTPAGADLRAGACPPGACSQVREAVGLRLAVTAAETADPGDGAGELVFGGWSDGGDREHEIEVPAAGLDLVAAYRPPRQGIGEPQGPVGIVVPSGPPAVAALAPQADLPVLGLDALNPFGPRAIGGVLRGAPRGAGVRIAVRRGGARRGCSWWSAHSGRFTAARRTACARPRWLRATVRPSAAGGRWRVALGRRLPPGNYAFLVQVLGADGVPVAFQRA